MEHKESHKESKEKGHRFLAKLGKTRLRPGGRKATEWLISQAGLTAESHVLEVACNMGTTAIEVARRYGCHITGIDMDKAALDKARQNIRQAGVESLVTVQMANALELPFPDSQFDVVINEAMLTMYPDDGKERLLKEYARVLKPGGRLLTHDLLLTEGTPEEILTHMRKAINVNAQPKTKNEWETLLQQEFSAVQVSHGLMTLLSPRGLVYDEGIFGALRIIRNALKPENRTMFMTMFRTFRRNRRYIKYIAACSTK